MLLRTFTTEEQARTQLREHCAAALRLALTLTLAPDDPTPDALAAAWRVVVDGPEEDGLGSYFEERAFDAAVDAKEDFQNTD